MAGYTVVDSSTVLATHLSHLRQQHAACLLGRTETQALVGHLTQRAPQLTQDVILQMIGIAPRQKILQSLAEPSAAGVTEPRLKMLAFSEIPDTHSIRIGSIIGAQP